MPNRVLALFASAHPGPTVAVTTITVILGFSVGLEAWRLVLVGLAMFANQLSIGLSNDWFDAARDRAVSRPDKPVALGLISIPLVRSTALACAFASIVLTLPLGWGTVAAQLVLLGSGWAYNLGLKSTALSVLPYAVGFGSLPLIVTLALPTPALAAPWVVLTGTMLGTAAHFSNVLPDFEDDHATGVRGLPHRLGRKTTGLVVAGALGAASLCIFFGLYPPTPQALIGFAVSLVLAVACAAFALIKPRSKWVFRLIIAGALVNVVMLASAGTKLVL